MHDCTPSSSYAFRTAKGWSAPLNTIVGNQEEQEQPTCRPCRAPITGQVLSLIRPKIDVVSMEGAALVYPGTNLKLKKLSGGGQRVFVKNVAYFQPQASWTKKFG